jgi:hypothetical protein
VQFVEEFLVSYTLTPILAACYTSFEAVESSNFFPLGVKVTYRAYSCDKVIEIHKKPSIACKSHYGQATGM